MSPRFGRPVPHFSIISSQILEELYEQFGHLLHVFNLPFLQPPELETYYQATHAAGAAQENCFGFDDGTVRPICRPGILQRMVYNGHKIVISLEILAYQLF